jgi:protein-tyrosine phosphatase
MTSSFIDIHSHILPGLDDGPETLDESIEMARVAFKSGITKIIATPHHNDYHQPSKEEIFNVLDTVNCELKKKNIEVAIYSGNELRIAPELPEKLSNQDALPLANSRYVLVEFPFNNIPLYAADVLGTLLGDGWKPILAHCERIYDVQQKPGLLSNYVNMGCLIQINSNSLTGALGRTSQKTALELLRLGYADIMASDAHSAYNRVPDFSEALKIVSKTVGKEKAEAMVSETPAIIFENRIDNQIV